MATTHDLVLRTRLGVISNSLERVRKTVGSIQVRQDDIKRLKALLDGSERGVIGLARDVGLNVEDSETALPSLRDSHNPQHQNMSDRPSKNPILEGSDRGIIRLALDVASAVDGSIAQLPYLRLSLKDARDKERLDTALKNLQQAQKDNQNLWEMLTEAKLSIDSIDERWVFEDETQEPGKTLDERLKGGAKEVKKELEDLEQSLDDSIIDAQVTNGIRSSSMIANAWGTYHETLFPAATNLFEEYVAFLGGVTLREANMDEGVCRIADALVQLLEGTFSDFDVKWRSLTIPSHKQAPAVERARMIRLGFPEWTIWWLPLVAHDFGEIMALDKALPNDILHGEAEDVRRSLVSDAIATYATGPAYACATVLLRLDPRNAYPEQLPAHAEFEPPHDARRAAVIFRVLEMMNKGTFEDVVKTLKSEWEAAVRQAHPEVSDEAWRKYEEDVNAWVASEEPVWLQALWDYLYKRSVSAYDNDAWEATREWTDALLNGVPHEINLEGHEDLVYVLNAAWRCRLKHPEKTGVVEDAAKKLYARIPGSPLQRGTWRPLRLP